MFPKPGSTCLLKFKSLFLLDGYYILSVTIHCLRVKVDTTWPVIWSLSQLVLNLYSLCSLHCSETYYLAHALKFCHFLSFSLSILFNCIAIPTSQLQISFEAQFNISLFMKLSPFFWDLDFLNYSTAVVCHCACSAFYCYILIPVSFTISFITDPCTKLYICPVNIYRIRYIVVVNGDRMMNKQASGKLLHLDVSQIHFWR